MGRLRGLIGSGVLACALCAQAACDDAPAPEREQRRVLLTPPDKPAIQRAKKQKTALFDEQGELLPSDVVLGGFPVPRGFELRRSRDHEWFLRSLEVSAEHVARYAEKRLFTGSLVRSSIGGVTFHDAQLRSSPESPKLTVRISPTTSRKNACELYIRQYVNVTVEKLTRAQAEARVLEAQRNEQ